MNASVGQPFNEPRQAYVFVDASPPWERIAVALLLGLFLAVGTNLIGNRAFEGQDYGFHVQSTFRLLNDPTAWFAQDITHRPLIYWIAIHGFNLTSARAPFQFAAFVFLLFNSGALWLAHDSMRRFIAHPLLRLAALALIGFWPTTTITTVVFAADAMAQPFFALLCWSLLRWHEVSTERQAAIFATLAGTALGLGNFAKFTFIFLPVGVVLLAFLAWRWRFATPRRILVLVALAVIAPCGVAGWIHHQCSKALGQKSQHHGFAWKGSGDMTWRSLLGLKRTDARIFDAPGYWDPEIINGKRYLPLLRENDYSYPALLHLGTFTDVLDFSNGGSQREWQPRPDPQKKFSQWSVRLGALFSVSAVVAVALFTVRSLRAVVDLKRPAHFALTVWLVLGLNWFVPLVVTLPFIENAYHWGYWLPRLVIPGLWSLGLCLFAWLDETVGRRSWFRVVLAVATGVQVFLQIRTVWY